MKAALAQLRIEWENPKDNMERAKALIQEAGQCKADLVILPELFSTGVVDFPAGFQQGPDGECVRWIMQMARENEIAICGSYIEASCAEKPFNSLFVVDGGGDIICNYRKMHLYPGESGYRKGDDIKVFDMCGIRFCPLICYDLRFGPLFWAARSMGAHAFIVCSNWPEKRAGHWNLLLSARALETRSYVIGVNCEGDSPKGRMAGLSKAYGTDGANIAGCEKDDQLCFVDIEVDDVRKSRSVLDPFLDMRRGAYNRFMEADE